MVKYIPTVTKEVAHVVCPVCNHILNNCLGCDHSFTKIETVFCYHWRILHEDDVVVDNGYHRCEKCHLRHISLGEKK